MIMKLAVNLTRSEEVDWHNQYRGLNKAQKTCTEKRYTHYFIQNKGLMQAGLPGGATGRPVVRLGIDVGV